jgi:hypothetical protein
LDFSSLPIYFPAVEFDFGVYFAFGNNRSWGPPISGVFLKPGSLVRGHSPLSDDRAPSYHHSTRYITHAAPIDAVRPLQFFSLVSSPRCCSPPRRSPCLTVSSPSRSSHSVGASRQPKSSSVHRSHHPLGLVSFRCRLFFHRHRPMSSRHSSSRTDH